MCQSPTWILPLLVLFLGGVGLAGIPGTIRFLLEVAALAVASAAPFGLLLRRDAAGEEAEAEAEDEELDLADSGGDLELFLCSLGGGCCTDDASCTALS